ncbi:hypothetical protein [Aidingimonas lacisalsi]|uniref:hypothetical protein n=1 Tax=Aidingimonas lacisalsi TaxID=2604086 RepID=UPI0011D1F23F|nr:hypothetical protein [Aidingimonas lacisalsi]
MNHKVYLHLGLHKTATTSMQQYVFPFVEGVNFLGREVIDLKDNSSLYKKIAYYCFSKEENIKLKKEIGTALENTLNDSSILISDEWFTADYSGFFAFDGAHWQMKIARLSELLEGADCQVILTIRHPFEGLYSQYCEFLSVGIDELYPTFRSYAEFSNDANAYHYEYLFKSIKRNFENLSIVTFDELKDSSGVHPLCDFFQVRTLPEIGHANKREKNNEGVKVVKQSKVVKFVSSNIPKAVGKCLRQNKKLAWLKNLLIRFISDEIYLEVPTKADEQFIKDNFSKSITIYKQKDF